MAAAQAALDDWVAEYNKARPHQAIGMLTPAERFALRGEACQVVLEEPPADPLATVTRKVASNGIISVSGQVFSVRANEIFLMGQSRPLRSVHRSEGWTPQTIAEHAAPALRPSFYPLERNQDVFSWDPV